MDTPSEQLLLISYDFQDGDTFGSKDELRILYDLEDELERVLSKNSVGILDGNEIGDSECLLYLYGEDADKMLTAVTPVLKNFSRKPIRILMRYGDVEDTDAPEKSLRFI